jgi:hypothetical protein
MSDGICVVRATSLSGGDVLITVTTNLDVTRPIGESTQNVVDADAAVALVARFLQQWRSVQKR